MNTPQLSDNDEELRKLLLWFVQDHIDIRGMDSESKDIFNEDLAAAMAALKQLMARQAVRERIDENDIWLSHSESRRLVDTEPAIRTVDFKERIAELKQLQGEAESKDV